jgi:hypothetical protein
VDGPTNITYSDIMGGWPGTGNIDEDPLLRDGASGKVGSPCIDCGDNSAAYLPAAGVDGQERVFDGDRDSLAVVDMGADEFVCFISAAADL